jgi:hypothetical protein
MEPMVEALINLQASGEVILGIHYMEGECRNLE